MGQSDNVPGPGNYSMGDKTGGAPAYSMGGRQDKKHKDFIPGPG